MNPSKLNIQFMVMYKKANFQSSKMTDRERTTAEWLESVVPLHPVPQVLFPHQLDAMALLKEGNHVFLGIHILFLIKIGFVSYCSGVPTGSGKTLPQLATVLTMPGT